MNNYSMELVGNLNSTVQLLFGRKAELEKKLSECDTLEQRILHYIELGSMDAVSGSKILKKLRTVRNERRQVKEEIAVLHSVTERLKQGKLRDYIVPQRPKFVCKDTLESLLK